MPEVLGHAGEADLGHHLAQREGGLDGVREVAARLRVEVDAQLVGVVDVGGADRPRVERDGVHLHRPHRARDLVEDELEVAAARRVGAHHRAGEVGHALGRVLAEELLALDPLREPLQGHGPVPERLQQRITHGQQVPARSSLVTGWPSAIPSAGQSTRSGLEIRTSRTVPSGAGTSSTAGLALTRRS